MDDHSFDKIIKEKLDHYEDPTFDPAALSGFHDKLASLQPIPWYQKRISHYAVAASLTLFTIVNAYLLWPKEESKSEIISETKTEQRTIDSLSSIIKQLQSDNRIASKERDSFLSLAQYFKSQVNSNSYQQLAFIEKTQPITGKVSLGLVSSLPPHLYNVLMEKGLLIIENEEAFLSGPESVNQHYKQLYLTSQKNEDTHNKFPELILPELEMKSIAVNTSTAATHQTKQRQISAKMRGELEKHYFTGLGIAVAPHLDFSKSVFSDGVGSITPRAGITADWILSPWWSVESGLDYSTTKLSLDNNFQMINLPLADSTLGEVENIEIKNSLVSVPLAIKYRQWVSEKTQAFIKIGYTPYFSIHQEYQWQHDFKRTPYPNPFPKPNPDPDDDHHHVTSVQETRYKNYYGATATASLGFTRLFKNKNKVEASLFYDKSLASVGREQLDMQLFGLRTAYWFKLR